jgi:hypothetical protein
MDTGAHRRRAEVLRERYPFAAEVLTLYLALLDVWEPARDERPEPDRLVGWALDRMLPLVLKATEEAGPPALAAGCRDLATAGGLEASLTAWLAGGELQPVARYLARASLRPGLEVDAGAACAADPAPRGGRRCPTCGGPPQVSVRTPAEDPLLTGPRNLICARCGWGWSYSGSSCAWCGETSGSRRTVYAEPRIGPVVRGAADVAAPTEEVRADPPTFPHLRVEACGSCQRYLIDVDLGRDPRAVPEVDELAAVPLDLYAAEHGLLKITPNLMGF